MRFFWYAASLLALSTIARNFVSIFSISFLFSWFHVNIERYMFERLNIVMNKTQERPAPREACTFHRNHYIFNAHFSWVHWGIHTLSLIFEEKNILPILFYIKIAGEIRQTVFEVCTHRDKNILWAYFPPHRRSAGVSISMTTHGSSPHANIRWYICIPWIVSNEWQSSSFSLLQSIFYLQYTHTHIHIFIAVVRLYFFFYARSCARTQATSKKSK